MCKKRGDAERVSSVKQHTFHETKEQGKGVESTWVSQKVKGHSKKTFIVNMQKRN
jgi:hypothetical protein